MIALRFLSALFFLSEAVNAAGLLYPRQEDTPLQHHDSRVAVPVTLQDPTKRGESLYERAGVCVIGHACSTGGCCSGSCCGNGCCPIGYTCHYVGSTPGCCPVGKVCGSTFGGCTSSNLVRCTNYNFCCPRGQTCSLLNGNAHCSGQSSGGNDYTYTTRQYTTTTTHYTEAETSTYTPPVVTTRTSTSTSTTISTSTSPTTSTSRTTTSTPQGALTTALGTATDNPTASQAAVNDGYRQVVLSNVGVACLVGAVIMLLS